MAGWTPSFEDEPKEGWDIVARTTRKNMTDIITSRQACGGADTGISG